MVSRETAPPAPESARGLFDSDRLPLAEAYAAWLAGPGTVRGLIGPREVPRLWERHLLNCAALAEAVPRGASVCDIGSGAGLPGVVLAIARPDLALTLVEPLLRRTRFLEELVADLELESVRVVRGRAEDLHGRLRFDVVTSRAVAPLARLLRWSMPLVTSTGELLAMKGSSAEEEIVTAGPVLEELGCATPEVLRLGEGVLSSPAVVVRVAWAQGAGVGLPRTSGRRRSADRHSRPPARRRRGRGE